MASVVLSGDTSGSITVAAPAVAGSNTQTLAAVTGTLAPVVSGTAVTCAGQTSIDFTNIPSYVKRITVMFNAVSTSGTSVKQIQIGDSGGFELTGYSASSAYFNTSGSFNNIQATSGFIINSVTATDAISGSFTISCLDTATNTWSFSGSAATGNAATALLLSGGAKSLSATLDRVRITTVNGSDTFDTTPSAGTINILYE
jgi:hypothetical protein